MAITSRAGKTGTIVVSALRARANFGKLLRRIDDERGSLVIEKRALKLFSRHLALRRDLVHEFLITPFRP
jgi:hypothetical protein